MVDLLTATEAAEVRSLARWFAVGGSGLAVVATYGFLTQQYGVWAYLALALCAGLLFLTSGWLWITVPDLLTTDAQTQSQNE